MTNMERYQAALKACAEACRIVCQHDIKGLLEAIEHAQTAGPLLDPTLYRDRAEALDLDAELLRLALPFVAYREKMLQKMIDRGRAMVVRDDRRMVRRFLDLPFRHQFTIALRLGLEMADFDDDENAIALELFRRAGKDTEFLERLRAEIEKENGRDQV